MSVQKPLDMKPEIRDEWVRRLRSGKYEQGKEWLNKDGKFCCLGVLCEMAAEQGVVEKSTGTETTIYGPPPYDSIPDQVLPDAVKEWAGLQSDDPLTYIPSDMYTDGCGSLAGLNDDGWLFADIADVIEGVYEV